MTTIITNEAVSATSPAIVPAVRMLPRLSARQRRLLSDLLVLADPADRGGILLAAAKTTAITPPPTGWRPTP